MFDLLALRPLGPAHLIPTPAAPGVNNFKGYNVHTIALQVPLNKLTMDGQAPSGTNGVIGVWATTSRRQTRVLSTSGYGTADTGDWVQIERLGNPLVNEVVVPIGVKDHFNATAPAGDAQFLPAVADPELGRLIPALYPGLTVPAAPRNDLITIFLTGIPGLNQPANVVPSEMLRLNLAVKPSADIGKGARMGVLAGDTAGYPNGRRLEDDVVDIALQAIVGNTPFTPAFNKSPNNLVGDGVNTSGQAFNTSFPYVSAPYQGYSHGHHGG